MMNNCRDWSGSMLGLFACTAIIGLLAVPLRAQQPTKEYIYLGGRVVAIEQAANNQEVREVFPTQKTYPASGQFGT